jgi:hypothetical protein
MLDGGLRGKARSTHPTKTCKPLAPPRPQGFGWGRRGRGGVRGKTARKAAWLLHQRSISVHQRSRLF